MAGSIGLNEFAEHSVAGSTFLAFDSVQSGSWGYEGGEIKQEEGTGGQVLTYRGLVVPTGNVSTHLQSAGLIACIEPASIGALPTVIAKIQGGVGVTAGLSRLHTNSYLKTIKFACAKDGLLTVDYSWIATTETDAVTTAAPVAKQTGANFPWHNMNPTFDSALLSCQSWEVTVDTGVEAQTSQDLKVSGVQRLPEWIDPGDFTVKFSASVRVSRAYNFTTDYPTTMAFKVLARNADGNLFTLDLSGGSKVHLNGDPIEIVKGKDAVLYKIEGETVINDLAAFAVSFA